jgi:hypothetical protein
MLPLLSALGSLLSFRVRSRASLELELVALRHQVTVLRRQHPGRPRLFSTDRVALGVALPDLAEGPRRHGAGQTGDGDRLAS